MSDRHGVTDVITVEMPHDEARGQNESHVSVSKVDVVLPPPHVAQRGNVISQPPILVDSSLLRAISRSVCGVLCGCYRVPRSVCVLVPHTYIGNC